MTDLSADFVAIDAHDREVATDADRDSFVTTLLSGLLIIGLPAVFWISVFEFANFVLSLGLSAETRLIVAGVLIGMLAMIWGFITVSARQRRSAQLEAELKRAPVAA